MAPSSSASVRNGVKKTRVKARVRAVRRGLVVCRPQGAIALLAATLFLSACAPKPKSPGQSFLLVSLDTVRADHLGAYGYPEATSPHFDRLARRSLFFAECTAQATATLPSHRSLFRSRVASRSRAETPMLAETMQAAGFVTAAFTGGGNIAGSLGFSAGFDLWEEYPDGLAQALPAFAPWFAEAMKTRFFSLVHTYDAHMPYDPPRPLAEYFDRGYAGTVTGPKTRAIARAIRGLDKSPEGVPALNDADRRHLVALYDGALRRADDLFGDLVRLVEASQASSRTTIVVFSDHGEEFWDHGSLLHSHTVHRELTHVPLLVAGAGVPSLRSETVRLLDVAPTILALAGLEPDPSHEGETLIVGSWPSGGGETATADAPSSPAPQLPHRPAITEMAEEKALFESPWKLIVSGGGTVRKLYHVESDPGEWRNILVEGASRKAGRADPDSIAEALAERLAAAVVKGAVEELSRENMSTEQRERLKALGYVN